MQLCCTYELEISHLPVDCIVVYIKQERLLILFAVCHLQRNKAGLMAAVLRSVCNWCFSDSGWAQCLSTYISEILAPTHRCLLIPGALSLSPSGSSGIVSQMGVPRWCMLAPPIGFSTPYIQPTFRTTHAVQQITGFCGF